MALVLTDRTANGNDLTNVNGATEVTTNLPFTPNTSAADLEDSSSQYFSAADSASLSFTSDFTVELWVKLETVDAGGSNVRRRLVAKYNAGLGAPASSFSFGTLYKGASDSTYNFELFLSDSSGNEDVISKAFTTPIAGTWYHWAVTWTAATKTAEFFIDASSQGTAIGTNVAALGAGDALFTIGQSATLSAGQYLDGIVDDVRVWSDIRTGTEITNNYNTELTGSEANLVAYYPFNAVIPVGGVIPTNDYAYFI